MQFMINFEFSLLFGIWVFSHTPQFPFVLLYFVHGLFVIYDEVILISGLTCNTTLCILALHFSSEIQHEFSIQIFVLKVMYFWVYSKDSSFIQDSIYVNFTSSFSTFVNCLRDLVFLDIVILLSSRKLFLFI